MTQKLMPDSQAPELSLPLVGGGTWALADQDPKKLHDGDFLSWPTLPCMQNVSEQAK